MTSAHPDCNFWHGKRILLTGHTGFKGGWLALEIAKAQHTLGIEPRLSLTKAVQLTMTWYQTQHSGLDARKLCENDIAMYEASY